MSRSVSAHLTAEVTEVLKEVNTDVAVIPGGLTGVLQPLDVSLNKPFKAGLCDCWMAREGYTKTKGGNMRAPPLDTCAKWVIESWDDIKKPIIIKSFKKCCISNAMVGTEDDMLWDHEIETADSNGGDDPLAMDLLFGPHNDQIHDVSAWQELLSGDNDGDSDNGVMPVYYVIVL